MSSGYLFLLKPTITLVSLSMSIDEWQPNLIFISVYGKQHESRRA